MTLQTWRFIDLGKTEPYRAQTFYEAVALAVDRGLSPSTLLVTQPASPYVCIGYHQDLEAEVDSGFCAERGLTIIRRGQGGGAAYLDDDQVFYQMAARKGAAGIPLAVKDLFARVLQVPVHVYRKLGLNAVYKPVNDVTVNGKKISGNGAGAIGSCMILVGNIILDLDYDSMAGVLRVPDEKFRDKMAKSMRDWVTSLSREAGHVPAVQEIKALIAEGFRERLGLMFQSADPTEEEEDIWRNEVLPRHRSEEWLTGTTLFRREGTERSVKIQGDVHIARVDLKKAKLIRVQAVLDNNVIQDVSISGDFFVIPESCISQLQDTLKGCHVAETDIEDRVTGFFKDRDVEMPDMTPLDFVEALLRLRDVIIQ